MRWGYLVPRVVIVLLVWTFFAFAFDPLVRRAVIASGQAVVGAKVDVGKLNTKFFPPALAVNGVAITDRSKPGTNLVEFAEFHVRLDGRALMKRSFIVEEGSVTGLEWGTPREDSGLLDEAAEGNPDGGPSRFAALGDKAKELGKDWLNGLIERGKLEMDPKKLESVQLADSLHKDWIKKFEQYRTSIKKIEMRIDQIRDSVKNPQGDTLEKINAYRTAANDVNQLLNEAKQIRLELQQLPAEARTDFQQIDLARQRDQQALKSKLQIFTLDAEAISESLMGEMLSARLSEAAEWIGWAKENYAKLTVKPPEPERMRGIDVAFSRKTELPLFLVKSLKISGQADINGETMPFKGTVSDITSNPSLLGKPTVISFDARGTARVLAKLSIDLSRETPAYDVALQYSLAEPQEFGLGNAEKMHLAVKSGKTGWRADLHLAGDALTGNLKLTQHAVSITANDAAGSGRIREDVLRIVQNALNGIHELEATVTVSGTYAKPQWKLQSNLGPQIAEGVNTALTQELEFRRQDLEAKLDAAVRGKLVAMQTMMNDKFQESIAGLNLNETQARELIEKVVGAQGLNLDALRNASRLKKFLRR